MRKFALLLSIICHISFSYASKLDSLITVYNQPGIAHKSELALKISKKYEKNNLDKAIKWGLKSLEHSRIDKNRLKEAASLKQLAYQYKLQGELDTAIVYYQNALNNYQRQNHLKGIKNCIYGYANTLEIMGNYYAAHDLYAQLLSIPEIANNVKESIRIYFALSNTKFLTCEYDRAFHYALKLEEVVENSEYKSFMPNVWLVKGFIYSDLEEYEKAEKFYRNIYDFGIRNDIEDFRAIYYGLHSGIEAMHKKDYHAAAAYMDSCYQIRVKQKNDEQIGYSAIFLGEIYSNLSEYNKAESYFEIAEKNLTKLGINKKLYELNQYRCAHYQRKGEFAQAIKYGNEAIALHKKFGLLKELPDVYKNLSDVYERKGFHEKAFQHLLLHNQLKDSIMNMASINSIKYLEMDYEQQENIEEINALQIEKSEKEQQLAKQRVTILLAVCIALILLVIATGIAIYSRQRRKLFEKEKEMISIRSALKGQENERNRIAKDLHDGIVSDLTGLKLYLKNNGAVASDIVDQLSSISQEVRVISHNLSSPVFFESNFEEIVSHYIDQFSANSGLEVKTLFYPKIDWDQIDCDIQQQLYRIVQEIVINTIKHAGATKLTVQVVKHSASLNLTIEDNGKGFLKEFTRGGKGLGNIQERVKLLDGDLTVDSVPEKSTMFSIDIPLNEDQIKQAIS